MTPELYRQASDIFNHLCEVPEAERPAAMESACAGNSELRAQVERLFVADSQLANHSFLKRRAMEDAASLIGHKPLNLPPPDSLLGNYRLGRRIGDGGMGVVFQAQDLRLDRRVALKILAPDLTPNNADQEQRFQRETRAVSALSHPNIVSVFDAGFEKNWFYIAMEFVDGQTLRQVISASAPRPDRNSILEWISQAAAALSAAHEANIVHRDVKPENIMLRGDGFIKVVDFGLAKLRESHGQARATDVNTRPGELPGTIHYLSPEQILGQEASPRSDLFALGVVAYELATGIRPFDGPTSGAIFNSILHHHPPAPSSLRPELGQELDVLIVRLLEKDPELRFQTATDLRSSCRRISRDYVARAMQQDRLRSQPLTENQGPNQQRWSWARKQPNLRAITVAAAVLVSLAMAAMFLLSRSRSVPRVTSITQITHDGSQKEFFVTDGVRIYYATGYRSQNMQLFQVSANGGDPVRMAVPPGMYPLDVSPDGTQLLLGQNSDDSLWVVSTVGGPVRRVGDLTADGAQFSPKGDEILYCKGPEFRIIRSDGSDARLLATVDGNGRDPAWSPDGRSIRFTRDTNATAVWEMSTDATDLHRVFPQLGTLPNMNGKWTSDGKYFVFAVEGVTKDLWVSLEHHVLPAGLDATVRLTNGPMQADDPQPTPDGRRIFFRGRLHRGELVRYDMKLGAWSPYLQGLAATQLDFSRDGTSIAYVSYPDGCVWRCNTDGSARLQLTTPPLFANNPRWSPDGRQILFYGARPGQSSRLYLVSAAGGAVRQLTQGQGQADGDEDGNWSADGKSIVFGAQFDPTDPQHRGMGLGMLDAATGKVMRLPGSEGMWSPRWSLDGRYIAAMRRPTNCLFLYDPATHHIKQLTAKGIAWPSWSRDSKYIYFGNDQHWRVRIDDGKLELIPIKEVTTAERTNGWVGVTPDGSPIATRDEGSTEIYALNWDKP